MGDERELEKAHKQCVNVCGDIEIWRSPRLTGTVVKKIVLIWPIWTVPKDDKALDVIILG